MLDSELKKSFESKLESMVIKTEEEAGLVSNKSGNKPESIIVAPKTLSSIYRAKVIDAYRDRRIFTVFGNYGTIRRSLLKRGWLEKLPPARYTNLQSLPEEVLLQHAKRGNDYESVVISKIINHFPAFFVWQPKGHRDLYVDVRPLRNRIRRSHAVDFSTKVGLIGCAEQQQWFRQDGVAEMLYPRFFRLCNNQEEQQAFIDEFRITQCRSVLRYLLENIDTPEEIANYENGIISPSIVHFALARVKRQVDDWQTTACLDIEQSQVPDEEWTDFLDKSDKLINGKQKIKFTFRELCECTKAARSLMAKIDEKHPDLKWDGCRNLWILKPGYQSRGLGIVIRNKLDDILCWSTTHSNRRYIVQKYIENPLLIYRTKFDIRQYMLVFIRESTVQIWLYTDCYLRFSSHEYTVDDLREVIHLTNNSVQKKYKNKTTRDHRLPKCNMWSLEQFKAYLKEQKLTDTWDRRTFSGIKENLIAVVLASLDDTNLMENSFELYGCDFMLDKDYNPILIEINSTPDLSPSTEVTARICPMVMQDCIKVVVDLPRNCRASTGLFQLVYEVNYRFKHDFNIKEGLNVCGKQMELCKRPLLLERSKFIKRNKTEVSSNNNNNNNNNNKNNNNSKNNSKHQIKRLQSKKLNSIRPLSKSSKTKTNESLNYAKSLKTVTKEALALRYTMPK